MRVIKSAPCYMNQIKKIWIDNFGDNERFNQFYFKDRYVHDNSYLLINECGEVVASLQDYNYDLKYDNKIYNGSYIYGACTKKNMHNRGYMSRLLTRILEIDKKNGKKFSCLVPANEQLFGFYDKFGYQKAFFYSTKKYIKNDIENFQNIKKTSYKMAKSEDFLTFNNLYNKFSNKKDRIILQGENLFSMYKEHLIYDDILIDSSSYIIVTKRDKDIIINEYFGIENIQDLLYNIMIRYNEFNQVILFCRQNIENISENKKAYGMIKMLDNMSFNINEIYMNMMMD